MRKLVLNLAISLDGLIAGPHGEFDWCFTDHDYGMTEFMKSIDATIMGRKSYHVLLDFGAPYPELTNYVISRTEPESSHPNVMIVRDNVHAFVEDLKSREGKNIWLYGGAEITHLMMERDLVDVMMLAVHPLVLGEGLSLFGKFASRKQFDLIDSIRYPSGLVQLIYNKR